MEKKDAKPRLIHWVLQLQEFYFEVTDRKGTKNEVANHLSRLEDVLCKNWVKKHKLMILSLMSMYWPLLKT